FSLDVTLAAGARSITAKATDAAGNVGVASAALSITVDSSAPLATLIAIDRASKTLAVNFDQNLSIAGTLPNSAFSVTTAGGTPNAVTSIAVNGNTVLLTLADPIGSGATAVTYTDPSAANDAVALQDAAGNDTATFSLSLGVVADGYIRGAQIFVETVSNGQVTRMDTGVVTDAQGNFFIPAQYAGLTLVAVGGVNVDTGIVNTTNYRAPAGSTVINPLTTVIQAVIDASPNSTSVAAASQVVADALGLVLPSGSSLTNFDPIASGNVEVQRAAAQIAAIVAIADVNASSDEAKVFANIANQVTASSASNGSVDLASTQLVSAALAGTTTGANASLVADIQSAVTTIDTAVSIAAISQAQSDAIDTTAPGAPTQIDLIAADDTGTSNTDNITSKNSFAGTVSFNTTATDGTAVVAGDKVQVIVGGQVFASRMLTEADVVAGQASINFVSVSDGTYSGSTRIVDKAGNISPQSAAVTFTVDSTAPSAVIQISDALLAVGESAQVSIRFTEAVIGFSNVDVLADNGSLSTFSSSDGGVTWTATFTPDVDIEDASNLIRLASSYTDIAGNLGGAADSPNFVIDTLPNRTPTVSLVVPDQGSAEDAAWSYQVPAGTFSDVDGDTLTYTATLSTGAALPSWLSFNAATRTFSGTPTQDFAGNVSLTVTASDGSASVSDTFVLTVSAVEDEATGSASISGTAAEGGSLTASVSATDVDGSITDTTYQWQVSSDGTSGWVDLSGATSVSYAIASDQSQVGKFLRVIATTTDALGGTSTLESSATAAVANVNDAPTVSLVVPDQGSAEDAAWSYQVPAGTFSDVD
ncbi:Ig-like domain-containing protein, partial [Sphingorhabdus rigui]